MINKEDALHNIAKYEDISSIIFLLRNIHNLYTMAHKGNQTALCIAMDLQNAIKDNRLTQKQQTAIKMKFMERENNVYIADQMGVTENAIRKHIKGGLKRISKILTVGEGWKP
jgi:DNA-directed RNA polymerase specialized sigma subunit